MIELPEHGLLEVFRDGTTLLFNQRHAAPLVGQKNDESQEKGITWYTSGS